MEIDKSVKLWSPKMFKIINNQCLKQQN